MGGTKSFHRAPAEPAGPWSHGDGAHPSPPSPPAAACREAPGTKIDLSWIRGAVCGGDLNWRGWGGANDSTKAQVSYGGAGGFCWNKEVQTRTYNHLISSRSGLSSLLPFSTTLSLPKCGKGKPALVRRNTVEDKSELIACIETGNFAKAARIAAGELNP